MDSILANADLIHRMCLIDEQVIRKQTNLAKNSTNQLGKTRKCMHYIVFTVIRCKHYKTVVYINTKIVYPFCRAHFKYMKKHAFVFIHSLFNFE